MGDEEELPNSFAAFVRSVRRASQFANPRPRLRRIILGRTEEEEITEDHRHLPEDDGAQDLHQHSTREHSVAEETTPLLDNEPPAVESDAEAEFAPLRSKLARRAFDRVEELQRKRDSTRAQLKDDEREPLLITKVQRDDGTEAEVIIGQSTLPQTIFNSANVLIGVGLLSLPLGIRYAGWVIGMLGLLASAWVTKYTAGLLAKCLDVDSSLANFGDIAYVAFGEYGRLATSCLIVLELLMTLVGLIVLFADTLQSMIDGPSEVVWKCICGVILLPLNFLPMRWLGYTSFLGIFCSIVIILVAFVMGFVNPHSPGSLREVAQTSALPENWKALPLSFGLIMALWTGHSVFPNIYRDMRHPAKYGAGLRWIFGFVTFIDIAMAVCGYLLYGRGARDELSTNMLLTPGYPYAVKIFVLVLIAIIPLTKFPIQGAPIISTLEVFTGIDERAKLLKPNRLNQSRLLTRSLRIFFRILVPILTVAIAIAIPSFELISALMGGLFGYLICVIIPIAFHLKMFGGQMTRRQLILDWTMMIVSLILAIVGTVWEFLPRRWVGLETDSG